MKDRAKYAAEVAKAHSTVHAASAESEQQTSTK